jgi:FkbM family methyltransferase
MSKKIERVFLESATGTFSSEALRFVTEFENGSVPKYVLGTNIFAKEIINNYSITGVIDDFTFATDFMGKPVRRAEEIEKNALVVSANILGRPITVRNRLNGLGLRNINYFLFRRIATASLVEVCDESILANDVSENMDAYQQIFDLLSDKESKDTLLKLLNFKLSARLDWMEGFSDTQYRQYFEDFLKLGNGNETFIDVGGHDGSTSMYFASHFPSYKKIHVFEPNPKIQNVLKLNLSDVRDVTIYEFGLSSSQQELKFSANGAASCLANDGDVSVTVKKLDDLPFEECSLIKMDIEGGEIAALEGAASTIEKTRPCLAIAAYHRPSDIREITAKVFEMSKNWKVYLRHYTEGVTETVLFFIPT